MFKPAWYINKKHSYSEYFISEDGWSITFDAKARSIYLDKYFNINGFKIIKNEEEISYLNQQLIKNLFEYSWSHGYQGNYTGDFFK